MVDVTGAGYHGRRRTSLPAMKLSTSLLSHLNAKSEVGTMDKNCSPRMKIKINEEEDDDPRDRSRSWSGQDKKNASRKGEKVPNLTNTKFNAVKQTPRIRNSSSPNDEDDQLSFKEDPVEAAGMKYNRGRRHSVDVLVTSHDKRVLKSKDDKARRAWAEICRVSDPHNFDASEYEKDCLPHGSSLFQSVLHELDESDDETESGPGNDARTMALKHKKNKHKETYGECKSSSNTKKSVRF